MNQVKLHGFLHDKYGEIPDLSVRDPAEAMRALGAQLPDFTNIIRSGEWYVVREFPDGSFALTEEAMTLGMQNGVIHILPAIEGAAGPKGKGTGKTILGIALITASFFIPGGQIFGMSYASMAFMTGVSLAFAGAALLIAPQPKMTQPDDRDDRNSFIFNGAVNPTGQGHAVGVPFGRIRVGSLPVATRIVTNEVGIPAGTTYNPTLPEQAGEFLERIF